jgi:hypothetical protein
MKALAALPYMVEESWAFFIELGEHYETLTNYLYTIYYS